MMVGDGREPRFAVGRERDIEPALGQILEQQFGSFPVVLDAEDFLAANGHAGIVGQARPGQAQVFQARALQAGPTDGTLIRGRAIRPRAIAPEAARWR